MSDYKKNLNDAIADLGVYFGITSKDSFIEKLALNQTLDIDTSNTEGASKYIKDLIFTEGGAVPSIGQILLDTTSGGYLTHEIISEIEKWTKGESRWAPEKKGDIEELKKVMRILHTPASFSDEDVKKQISCYPAKYTIKDGDEKEPASMSTMVVPDEPMTPLNRVPKDPDKNNAPSLSAFQIFPASLTPSNKDTGACQIFLNSIPTHEMSRCVPYLKVQLLTGRPPLDESNRSQSTSLVGFLHGRSILTPDTPEHMMATSSPVTLPGELNTTDAEVDKMSSAGMELFTMPQTMVNADEPNYQAYIFKGEQATGAGPRSAPVIDKFRPMATLQNFSVSVVPSGGLMTFKTANMSFTVHDRSRLSEISEFVKPDLWGETEFLIEYGWSHPDGLPSSENPIGEFLNAMRVVEKYKVSNSQFKFDDVGQVSIDVSMYMAGNVKIDQTAIGHGSKDTDNLVESIEDITKAIRVIRERMNAGGASESKAITVGSWLNSVSNTQSAMGLNKDAKESIAKFLKTTFDGEAEPDVADLRSKLEALYGKDGAGTSGALKELTDSVSEVINKRLATCETVVKPAPVAHRPLALLSGDPFFRQLGTAITGTDIVREWMRVITPAASKYLNAEKVGKVRRKGTQEARKGGKDKFVSFGKLFCTFVGQPLAMSKQFTEVQIFFYAFNDHASYLKDCNIAQYPIRISKLKKYYKEEAKTNANMSLRRFMGWVNRKFVGDSTDYPYGLSQYYKDSDEGNRVKANDNVSATAIYNHRVKTLKDAYKDSSGSITRELKFKQPRLGVLMECIPVKSQEPQTPVTGKLKTILRIHVFDKQCTSYSCQGEMLKSTRNTQMSAINTAGRAEHEFKAGEDGQSTNNHHNVAFKKLIEKATGDYGILQPMAAEGPGGGEVDTNAQNADPKYHRINGGFVQLKHFIKQTMPSVTYGTSNSAVLNASLSSQNDPMLATIMMQRQNQGEGNTSAQTAEKGLPTKINPVQLTMETIGCPTLRAFQQWFIDFGTGTTADNVYAITTVSHSISAGEFKTSLGLVQLDTFGQYETLLNVVEKAITEITDSEKKQKEAKEASAS